MLKYHHGIYIEIFKFLELDLNYCKFKHSISYAIVCMPDKFGKNQIYMKNTRINTDM